MPRTARTLVGGLCYHVLNRGNRREQVFYDPLDYHSFITLMTQANERVRMRVLGYCLMPNHFHFVLWPRADCDISRWMHWLMSTHARRHHMRYSTEGRIWQGPFKAIPVQENTHLINVLRYVERNPLRAGLVTDAKAWRWSSLHSRDVCHALPFSLPSGWVEFVNRPQSAAEEQAIRQQTAAGLPIGAEEWQRRVRERLGLPATRRPRGRPPNRSG